MTENENDVSLAVSLDNVAVLETVFHTEKLPEDNSQVQLQIVNPENYINVDVKAHRTVMRSTVGIRYAIVDEGVEEPADTTAQTQDAAEGASVEPQAMPLLFNVLVGIVTSVPFMGDAAVSPGRHMAGADGDDVAYRDKKMEQTMRVEAIKAAHAFASTKLAEFSAMSPLGQITLPLIDADEILNDIMKNDASGESA